MSDDAVSLAAARVARSHDGKDWTVEECLKTALKDIQSGKLKANGVYIALVQYEGELAHFPNLQAGLTRLELLGLLAHHLTDQSE